MWPSRRGAPRCWSSLRVLKGAARRQTHVLGVGLRVADSPSHGGEELTNTLIQQLSGPNIVAAMVVAGWGEYRLKGRNLKEGSKGRSQERPTSNKLPLGSVFV